MTTRRPLGPRPPRPPEDSWWWDALYDPAAGDTNHTPPKPRRPPAAPRLRDAEKDADRGPDADPDTPAPAAPEQQPDLRDRLRQPRETPLRDALRDTNIKPRQQAKTRTAIYWGTAAAAGWWAGPDWRGIGPRLQEAITYMGNEYGVDAAVWYGAGFIVFAAVAAWRVPVWICRIPLAAAVLALALYGPDATL